jgi:hypothetical protein
MGRGLSKMQRLILERAVRQQWVCIPDICEFYFHWPLARSYFTGKLENALPRYSKGMPKSPRARYLQGHPLDNTLTEYFLGTRRSPVFSQEKIGRSKYHSGFSSMSRAFRRLRDRGLLERSTGESAYSRHRITEKGLAMAKSYGLAKKARSEEIQAKLAAWQKQEQKAREQEWRKWDRIFARRR